MTAAIRAEGRFELLIRSGNGWTPAGRFRTRRSAEAAARDMGAVEAGATIPAGAPRYLIEDHGRKGRDRSLLYYCVVRLADSRCLYCGVSEDLAAEALGEPGTIYASGESRAAAQRAAAQQACRIRTHLIEDRRHACRQWLQLAEAGR